MYKPPFQSKLSNYQRAVLSLLIITILLFIGFYLLYDHLFIKLY